MRASIRWLSGTASSFSITTQFPWIVDQTIPEPGPTLASLKKKSSTKDKKLHSTSSSSTAKSALASPSSFSSEFSLKEKITKQDILDITVPWSRQHRRSYDEENGSGTKATTQRSSPLVGAGQPRTKSEKMIVSSASRHSATIPTTFDPKSMLKIITWNVAGLRAIIRKPAKGGPAIKDVEYFDKNPLAQLIKEEQPDVLCLQETKLSPDHERTNHLIAPFEGYTFKDSISRHRKGYSGTRTYLKNSTFGLAAAVREDSTSSESIHHRSSSGSSSSTNHDIDDLLLRLTSAAQKSNRRIIPSLSGLVGGQQLKVRGSNNKTTSSLHPLGGRSVGNKSGESEKKKKNTASSSTASPSSSFSSLPQVWYGVDHKKPNQEHPEGRVLTVKVELPTTTGRGGASGNGNRDKKTIRSASTSALSSVTVVNTYVFNAGEELVRLEEKINKFNPSLEKFVAAHSNSSSTPPTAERQKNKNKKTDNKTPNSDDNNNVVIWTGDLNVAPRDWDRYWPNSGNWKSMQQSAGFTPEERQSISSTLKKLDMVDVFSSLYPNCRDAYTFWSYRFNRRANNEGWRLDHFFLPRKDLWRVVDSFPLTSVQGSDHCPVALWLKK